jgi:AraC-like DNA-binding protein
MLYDTSRPYLADFAPDVPGSRRLLLLWFLADPRLAARPINATAARWGFTSHAHFSQAFRNAYGLSPRQFRQQCATVRAG